MSEKNLEIVRRLYDMMNCSFRDREFPEKELDEILDDEARFDISRNIFNPGVYEGMEGARRMFNGLWDVWQKFEVTPLELLVAGDKVAVRLEMRGRARDGIEGSRVVGNVFTFRDGRVMEIVGGLEWVEAVDAVGTH